jgi:hypothetical protein
MLFWAETSEAPPAPRRKGRLAQEPALKDHPFCLPPAEWTHIPGLSVHLAGADQAQTSLRLPTTRSGPQPSPALLHDWELDEETAPFLAPWRVSGLWLPAGLALEALIDLPAPDALAPQIALSSEVQYWRTAAALVVETLAAQKFVPVLAPADAKGQIFHARWLPVLDSAKDAARLARLEAAMPPICRAEITGSNESPSPRALLDTFVKTMTDAQVRRWGASAATATQFTHRGEPVGNWLAALFRDDPKVNVSAAQLDALAHSQRAWLRNLHMAGDGAFCIAFRLEAPSQRIDSSPEGNPAPRQADSWLLHFLLQARDDASLLVPAAVVWRTRGGVLKELGRRFEQPQEKLLAGLGYAARLFPPIASSLKAARPTSIPLDTQQAYAFLREAARITRRLRKPLTICEPPGGQNGLMKPGRRTRPPGCKQLESRYELYRVLIGDWRIT